MTAFLVWSMVLTATAIGVGLTLHTAELSWRGHGRSRRRAAVTAGSCFVALMLLALVYKAKAVATVDAEVVRLLARSRGNTVSALMTNLTTLGDAIPSFVIAGVLAVVIFRQGHHRVAALLLPLLVFAELAVQIGIGKVFHDITIKQVFESVPIGGAGTIPSGSVTRLSSLFLVAAFLWYSHDPRTSSRVVTLGAALLVLQIVSRLYLGRHLVGDIAGGLLLGLILTSVVTLVAPRGTRRPA